MQTINRQLSNAMQNLGNCENNTQQPRPGSLEKSEVLLNRYGSLQSFKDTFCPAAMAAVAKDPGRAYNGTAPTLEVVRLAFGGDADIAWLYTFLDYFVQYCGKNNLTNLQMTDVARRIAVKSHLKVTEIMVFFWRLGNADYGRIYGTIDPLYIMDGFNKFLKQREKEFGEYVVSTTDEVAASSDWPIITPEEFYNIAMSGNCIDPNAAEIALETLGPYGHN